MPENSSSGIPAPEIIFFEFQGKLTAPIVETIPREGQEATWTAHPKWVHFCIVIPYHQSNKVRGMPETPYVAFYDLFKQTKLDEFLYRRDIDVDLSKPISAENLQTELSKAFGEYAKVKDWIWTEDDVCTTDAFFRWFGDYEALSGSEQEFFFSVVLSGSSEDKSKVHANALAWERKSKQHLAYMEFEEAFDRVLSPEWVTQKGRDLWIAHLKNLQ